MRDVGRIEPLHPAVAELLLLNLEGKLDDATTAALGDTLAQAKHRGAAGREIEAVAVVTGDRKVNLLHPPGERADDVSSDTDHLEKKHAGKGTFTRDVTPITFIGLSNSCCFYIGGKCYCW